MRTCWLWAIFVSLVCLGSSSVLRADQTPFLFMAGGTHQKNGTALRQEIHIFLNSERRALSSMEIETSPFNAILKLRRSYAGTANVSECTAFAVDRSIIVTAAHCIHFPGIGPPQQPSISVIQGLSAARVSLSPSDAARLKVSNATTYYDGWQDTQSHYDCAVLELDTPLPNNVTPFELDESGAICRRAPHLETAGYTGAVLRGDPAGIRNVQSYDSDCHDRSSEFDSALQRIGTDKMIIDCSGDKGASGSPIYCSANDKHYAVGIFSAENSPLHMEAVPFGAAWNYAEKISTCAMQVRKLKQTLYRAAH